MSSAAWKSTKGGLAIGDITGDKSTWIIRQISGGAAGTQDTDAVNVAQLKAVEEEGISLTGNDNQKIT